MKTRSETMKCIILAAGFGTRLERDIRNSPERKRLLPLLLDGGKCLLPIVGIPALSILVKWVCSEKCIKEIYIITNAKYFSAFLRWKTDFKPQIPIHLINNKKNSAKNRNGAVRDLWLVLKKTGNFNKVLVLAADTLYKISFKSILNFYKKTPQKNFHLGYYEPTENIHSKGVLVINKNNKIIQYEEKPNKPVSKYAAAPFYIFNSEVRKLLKQYLEQTKNHDHLGEFITWLIKRTDIYAMITKPVIDLGNLEDYLKLNSKQKLHC